MNSVVAFKLLLIAGAIVGVIVIVNYFGNGSDAKKDDSVKKDKFVTAQYAPFAPSGMPSGMPSGKAWAKSNNVGVPAAMENQVVENEPLEDQMIRKYDSQSDMRRNQVYDPLNSNDLMPQERDNNIEYPDSMGAVLGGGGGLTPENTRQPGIKSYDLRGIPFMIPKGEGWITNSSSYEPQYERQLHLAPSRYTW